MKSFTAPIILALATFTDLISALSLPIRGEGSWNKKPAAFYLAGDSTTAAQSANGGGWGVGFLSTLTNGAIGTDLGYNGATTTSFVSGGAWANVIDAVTRAKAKYTPYVTIQFGHNDQKATSGINITQFSANLKQLASEAIAAGGIPIMVTSLSRRTFNTTTSLVIQNLEEQRLATIAVANSLNISYIDLNLASTAYLNSIGQANAATYNLVPADFTHLNAAGSVVFGAMVSELLTGTTKYGADIARYSRPNVTVVGNIKGGVYVFPEV